MSQAARKGVPSRPRPGYELDWGPILQRGAEIVEAADLGMTCRDCWYDLYSEGWFTPHGPGYNNPRLESSRLRKSYDTLSSKSAEARRQGWFPDFIDTTRKIEGVPFWSSAEALREQAKRQFRLDRTIGQPWQTYLGIEKRGHVERLKVWFGNDLGIPVLPLGGNASQSLVGQTRDLIAEDDRPSVFVYAGDLDPSGEDIERDFIKRVGFFDKVERVGLNLGQLYDDPERFRGGEVLVFAGKPKSHRAKEYAAKYRARLPELEPGHHVTERIRDFDGLFQVEVNALLDPPLQELFQETLDAYWDEAAYEAVLAREEEERGTL
jgi:hypothetical protein